MKTLDFTWDDYLKGAQSVGIEFAEMLSMLPDPWMDLDKMDERVHLLQEMPLQRRLMLLHFIGSCIGIPVECLPLYIFPDADNLILYDAKEVEKRSFQRLMDISYYLEYYADENLLPVFFYNLGFDRGADPGIKKIMEKRRRRVQEFLTRPVPRRKAGEHVSPE